MQSLICLLFIYKDYIQNSLGDLVSLWALNETLERRPSVGTAIVELGRIETWLLRHARGENEPQSHFGIQSSSFFFQFSLILLSLNRSCVDTPVSSTQRRLDPLSIAFRSRQCQRGSPQHGMHCGNLADNLHL